MRLKKQEADLFVEEHDAKKLIASGGVPIPAGAVAHSTDTAYGAAKQVGGPVMVKAQGPTGSRGQDGAIVKCDSPDGAREAAARLLGSPLGEFAIERVLVEACADIAHELSVAVTIDLAAGGPLLMLSTEGGTNIDEVQATSPEKVHLVPIDIRDGFSAGAAMDAAARAELDPALHAGLAGLLLTLYGLFRRFDAQLLEINPLAVTTGGEWIALDCTLVIDDNALFRQPEVAIQNAAAATEAAESQATAP